MRLCKNFRKSLKALNELLAIDKKSMMGLYRLYTNHKRLCEAKGVTKPFGGISIIIMGYFAQLPPVLDLPDLPLYTPVSKVYEQKIFLTCALSLFKLFEKAVVLNEIMRQQGDDQKEFRDLLTSIAKGTFGKVEWEQLKQRDLDGPNFTTYERVQFNGSIMPKKFLVVYVWGDKVTP